MRPSFEELLARQGRQPPESRQEIHAYTQVQGPEVERVHTTTGEDITRMAIDVEQVLAQYEQAPVNEPMHGRPGEPRRNPSTDQKRVRRELARKADLEDTPMTEPVTEAQLLRTASRMDISDDARRDLYLEVERIRTARTAAADVDRSLDLSRTGTQVIDHVIPGSVHELNTSASDWITQLPTVTSSTDDAHSIVAEATMWFARVSDDVKQHKDEFDEQAKNLARRLGSKYGDDADAMANVFQVEANRLHAQAVKRGTFAPTADVTDSMTKAANLSRTAYEDLYGNDMGESNFADHERAHDLDAPAGAPLVDHPGVKPLPGDPDHVPGNAAPDHRHPMNFRDHGPSPFAELKGDTSGLHGMSDAFVDSQLRRSAAFSHDATASADADEDEEMFGGDPYEESHEKTSGLEYTFAALSATDATQGAPVNTPATFPDNQGTSTDSNRAPALQEIQNFTGYGDYPSVVNVNDDGLGQSDNKANQLNDNTSGTQDASSKDGISGFPVGASLAKESQNMTHAQCPTCSGSGHVAVRKEAYSGLPQIDQIVNADETPGNQPAPGQSETFPSQVAFPITGWVPGNVESKIGETEQQIANRPQGQGGAPGAPIGPGGSVAASFRPQANGRDNSGWMGDMGAKGIDYPGYSTPTGYDGSNNLGQPDPVYGFGGDNGNQPHLPYGHQEANDVTNNPGQPYDPSSPHNDDQGQASVSPTMNTQGSRDPFIGAAQEEILRQQEMIRTRTAMLQRQQG